MPDKRCSTCVYNPAYHRSQCASCTDFDRWEYNGWATKPDRYKVRKKNHQANKVAKKARKKNRRK